MFFDKLCLHLPRFFPARGFRQDTMLVVMNQLQDPNDENRVSALKIIKHLVTHLGEEIDEKKILLGNILPLCEDEKFKVLYIVYNIVYLKAHILFYFVI